MAKGLGFIKKDIANRIKLYDNLIAVQLTKNTSINNVAQYNSSLDKVAVDFTGAYAKDNLAFYYIISGYPYLLQMDFKEKLRRHCKPGVRLNFLNHIRGYEIDWGSAKMNNQFRVLENTDQEIDEKSHDRYRRYKNVQDVLHREFIRDSIDYLTDSDKARGRASLNISMLMVITGKRGEDFDMSVLNIEKEIKKIGLKVERVLYNIPTILHSFSPFKINNYVDLKEYIPTQLVTDEILARFNTYRQGIVGYKGDYFGTDIHTGFPVIKKIKPKNDSAENWLITAETGGGKSFFIKVIILALLSNNFRGTIMDIEGFEYLPLAEFVGNKSKVQILTLAEGCGKYFDPVEIAVETGVKEIDEDRKTLSTNFTFAILKVLLKDEYEKFPETKVIVDDAVTETYSNVGVTADSTTWHNSKGLTLHDVYKTLKGFESRYVGDEFERFRNAFNVVRGVLAKYFEPNGTNASMFAERVKVEDIIYADLVVCRFNMAAKSENSLDSTFLTLMQLSAAQISHQRSIYSKYLGKFNFKIWEEFQRWGKFEGSDKTIGVAVTGGRKLGDINIIITNNIKDILDDDRFAIIQNMQSYMIGAIPDSMTRKRLCERIGIQHLQSELDEIAKNTASKINEDKTKKNKGMEIDSSYTQAFLCYLDKNKVATSKMMVPQKIIDLGIFDTGVEVKE